MLAVAALASGGPRDEARADGTAVGRALFESATVPTLRVDLAPGAADSLRADPRSYVRCRLSVRLGPDEEACELEDVAVKLKGALGSFRELDDKPALTINADKFRRGQTLFGLDKFHLNNSVQDETFMHEMLGADIAMAAGLPAPRVAHARLFLDGRDLGIVVLKEAFDEVFLGRWFDMADGNLYDGGLLQEIDAGLERDEGRRGEPGADLAALAGACREADAGVRRRAIEERLDVAAFITFMAFERMTAHWDGYCVSRNNYRVYFDPARGGRAVFMPHGMDQVFGDPDDQILGPPPALVAAAVMEDPEWREAFRRRVVELMPLFDAPGRLVPLIDAAAAKLRPVLDELGAEASAAHAERMADLRQRLHARQESLARQAALPAPGWPVFDGRDVAPLDGWAARVESGQPALSSDATPGRATLSIECGGDEPTIASWRVMVALRPARYVLRGRGRVLGLVPVADEKGRGAGLRISGASRINHLAGDADWTPLAFAFGVESPGVVELVAEARGLRGRVDFDPESLELVRVPVLGPEDAAAVARARLEERHGPSAAWQGPEWSVPLATAFELTRALWLAPILGDGPAPDGRFAELETLPHPEPGVTSIRGAVAGGAPVFVVLGAVQPDGTGAAAEQPAVTATDDAGRFVLDCPGFATDTAGRVCLTAWHVDGAVTTVTLGYVVDGAGGVRWSGTADRPEQPGHRRGEQQ